MVHGLLQPGPYRRTHVEFRKPSYHPLKEHNHQRLCRIPLPQFRNRDRDDWMDHDRFAWGDGVVRCGEETPQAQRGIREVLVYPPSLHRLLHLLAITRHVLHDPIEQQCM